MSPFDIFGAGSKGSFHTDALTSSDTTDGAQHDHTSPVTLAAYGRAEATPSGTNAANSGPVETYQAQPVGLQGGPGIGDLIRGGKFHPPGILQGEPTAPYGTQQGYPIYPQQNRSYNGAPPIYGWQRLPYLQPESEPAPASVPNRPDDLPSGTEQIPVLPLGKKPQQDSTQYFNTSDPAARIYDNAKNAVVQVTDTVKGGWIKGSGFFVSSDGKLMTDNHVVSTPGKLTVTTANGTTYDAHVINTDGPSDLAELQVTPKSAGQTFPTLPLAESSTGNLSDGQPLFSVGHPNGWPDTYLSEGNFNDYSKRADTPVVAGGNPEETMIVSNLNVQPGSSGSPLLNKDGQVVGIVDYSGGGNGQTIAGSTPVDEIHDFVGDGKSPPGSSYVIPSSLHLGMGTLEYGGLSAYRGFGLLKDLQSVSNGARPSMAGGLITAAIGGLHMPDDFSYLKSAMNTGSTAEKVDAGIDVGTDAMMLSGTLGLINPDWRVALGAVQLAGVGIKLVNDLMSNRRY